MATGRHEGLDESVNIAEGFMPKLISVVDNLTSVVASLMHQKSVFGTSGSGPQSVMVDGGDALAGHTTTQSLAGAYQAARVTTSQPSIGYSGSAYTNAPAQPSPNTHRAPAQPAGGFLQRAGQSSFIQNMSRGTPGGYVTPAGGGPPVYVPPKGPSFTGGSQGGTGSDSGLYGGTMASLEKLPYVGQALGVVDEIQSQRQKNAYYQNVEGTDNLHGFGERYNESMGSFTTMGMFAPGEYQAMYQGATKLGYTDRSDKAFQSRQGVINFGYDNKSQMGMDASESLKYATMASKSATTSFAGLTAILKQVSDEAGKAGVNANFARQQTMDYYQAMLGSGMTGASATSTAGAYGTFQTAMGKTASDNNQTGIVSKGMNYMVASTNGMTYNQFMSVQNKNPMQAEQMREKTQNMGLDSIVTSEMKSWIKAQVTQAGGVAAIEADQQTSGNGAGIIDNMYSDFLGQFPAVDWNSLKSAIQTFSGTTYGSDTAAFQWLVNWVVGIDAHTTAIANMKKSQVTQGALSGNDLTNFKEAAGKAGPMGVAGNSDAANAYIDQSQKTGKRDPVAEALLTKMNSGGYSQQDQQVKVRLPGGPRVMSLADAMKNYPDLLATGDVSFIGGQLDKQSVASVSGTAVDMSASRVAAANKEKANPNNGKIGQALNDYLKDNKVNGATTTSGGTNVQISLTDQAAQWLKYTVTGNDPSTDPNTGNQNAARTVPGTTGGFTGAQTGTAGYGSGA